MTDTKPKCRILLDVDGVLNAVCRKPDLHQWGDWDEAACMGYHIRYSPTVGKRLLALTELPGVELLWLTTWEYDANKWIGPLFGWPRFDVLERHDLTENSLGLTVAQGPWWKLVEAQKLWDEDGIPFVWIDDDLGFMDDGATDWVRSLDGQALAIRPDTRKGLTPRLLDEIESFVAERLLDDV
jgi:hypothetical protein